MSLMDLMSSLLAAFCFYNLSSIVNGLVYFDQFGLISPLHLGLVGLGIIVLLVGVWVVSIQAGGGASVDVAGWDEEENEALSQEGDTCTILSNGSDGNADDIESRGRAQSVSNTRPAYGATRMDRQVVSESQVSGLPSFQVRRPTDDDTSPLSLSFSATSPLPLGRRPPPSPDSSLPLSPSTRARRRHRPSLSGLETSPPLGGTSVLGGGLSIGLGPMSPGFSIVPRDRRRKVSGHGHGFADVVDDAMGERRRTVSGGTVQLLGESGSSEPTEAAARPASPTSPKEVAKRRWGWVRSLVRR